MDNAKNLKAKMDADSVATMLNSSNFDEKAFCTAMCGSHRTLQQNFTRLCVEWLRTCGSDNYQYDDRNKGSHLLGKTMGPVLNPDVLPFI